MDLENYTSITEFVLLGFTDLAQLQVILFMFVLLCYTTNVIGNLFIIIITSIDISLHTPMYYFLGNLAFIDICFSSVTVPNMLRDFFALKRTISYAGCITQIHFLHFLGSTEALTLTVMSYDRYVAIAHPLRYSTIMSARVCLYLCLSIWIIGYSHSMLHTVMAAKLQFCGPNLVKHFVCEIKPLLQLSCTNKSFNVKLLTRITGTFVTTNLLLTLLSYMSISRFLLKIRNREGQNRAFSTCSAHLTVVTLLYGTVIFTYSRSSQDSFNQDRAAAIMFIVVTPVLNPIIYTLRNKDMKKAMKKALQNLPFRRLF